MDPLSLTANIIAVVSTVSGTLKRVQKLSSLRNAPQELLQFSNEISDFQVILTLVRESSAGHRDDDPSDIAIKAHLMELLSRATKTLKEFDDIMQNKIGAIQSTTDATPIKFSWISWGRNVSRLRELSGALRTVRLDMNQTLTMMAASQIPRIRARLAEVTTHQANTEIILQNTERHMTHQIETLVSAVSTLHTGIGSATTQGAFQATTPPVRVQTSVFSRRSSCKIACSCRCHKFTKYQSPNLLQSIIGKLLVGYSTIPSRTSCNERRCRPQDSWLLTVSYYFPRWFLGLCMISFRDRWNPIEGHSINVRMPRLLQSSTAPAIIAIQTGNLSALKRLFEQGLASPFDVNPMDYEPLLVTAVSHFQPEICAFLLDQCADPTVDDIQGRSAIDLVWNLVWTQSKHPESQCLQQIFQKHLDPDETVEKTRLNVLHRIILGLSPISLKAQLQTSTTEIDMPDLMGRTPLHWATRLPSTMALEILLEFGARIDVVEISGRTPLHYAATFGTLKALEILLAVITRRQYQGLDLGIRTTISDDSAPDNLLSCCLERQSVYGYTLLADCIYVNGRVEIARALLDAGADVHAAKSSTPSLPLTTAISTNNHTTILLLLERGARLDLYYDAEKQGILHITAMVGDFETIQIIASAFENGLEYLNTEARDIYNHTPLQIFDTVRSQVISEDEATHQECRQAFLDLLNRVNGHTSPDNSLSVQPRIEEISLDDEDIFFDAEENPTAVTSIGH